jgi:hypothetical protein
LAESQQYICSKRFDFFDVCNGLKYSESIRELLSPVTHLRIREKRYKEKYTAASLKFSFRKNDVMRHYTFPSYGKKGRAVFSSS